MERKQDAVYSFGFLFEDLCMDVEDIHLVLNRYEEIVLHIIEYNIHIYEYLLSNMVKKMFNLRATMHVLMVRLHLGSFIWTPFAASPPTPFHSCLRTNIELVKSSSHAKV